MAGIRPLTLADIQQARELSDAEGWNQSWNDWKLLVTSPGNICLAVTTGDKIIATATAMIYSNKLAWIGMVLVHREHRGKGLSTVLLNELLLKLKSVRLVKLDATPAGLPVYTRLGFKSEYVIYRMTVDAVTPGLIKSVDLSVLSVNSSNLAGVTQYDKSVAGVSRKYLIEYLVNESPGIAFFKKKKGKMEGFVLGRAGARFCQIGPLLAESTIDAKELLLKAFSCISGKSIVVDIPEDKDDFINWLQYAGFQIQRKFVRMYLGEEHTQGIPAKLYLIGGPEFG